MIWGYTQGQKNPSDLRNEKNLAGEAGKDFPTYQWCLKLVTFKKEQGQCGRSLEEGGKD